MSGDIDAEQWRELAKLFDDYSELPSDERDALLGSLRVQRPTFAARLSAMFVADQHGDGLLERSLDEVAPALDAQLRRTDPSGNAGQVMGRYRLLSPLGAGGMGEVWLAERADGEYRQNVALKLLKRGMDTDAILRRFLQERSILARLTHPNIVRLLDGGMSADGRPFYAMEHVDGQPVVQYATSVRLDVRERVVVVAKIADAVSYAHSKLVVHRDLKPSNILVDANGEPHLLDFGIAKLLEETGVQTMTGTQVRVMSPAYAAPEQILGEPVGTSTDVYSLGVILFELLTGHLPHRRTSRDPAVMAAELDAGTGRASQMLAKSTSSTGMYGDADVRRMARLISGDLDLIIARATHRDPERRYRTMSAFADDLRRWLDGRPIVARPDSKRYRAVTFVRRHRVGVAAALVAMVALLAGLGAALWQAGEARQQAARAEQQAMRAERVKEFLISLFRQNDPEFAHGHVITASQVMTNGVDHLSTMLADDPQTRGELYVAIAEIQYNLGEFDSALANVDAGKALLEGVVAASDHRLAQASFIRGKTLASLDRPTDAEAALLLARSIYGEQTESTAERIDDIEQGLATVFRYTRGAAMATSTQREVVARSLARNGEGSYIVAERRFWLALVLEELGEFEEARALYPPLLAAMERLKGPLNPLLCRARSTYAGLLDRLGAVDEASAGFDRSLDCLRQLYGERSQAYTITVFSRGILRLGQRRFEDAEADFRTALAGSHKVATYTGHGQRYLGQALLGQHRYPEAADAYRLAELSYREADLPKDVQRWRARSDYGYARFKMGEAEEGRQAVVAGLEGMRKVIAKDDVTQMRPLMALGEILRAQGDIPGALAAHREWRELALSTYGPGSAEDMQSAYHLALDQLAAGATGDLIEAKSLIDVAIATGRERNAPHLTDYLAAGERIDKALASAR